MITVCTFMLNTKDWVLGVETLMFYFLQGMLETEVGMYFLNA